MPNSSWSYSTGNYSVSVTDHSNANGTINLTKDASGNLNSTATWTPGGSSQGQTVNVSWDGTTLSWTVGNATFGSGSYVSGSNPNKFQGNYSHPSPKRTGPGTWTATSGG